MPIIDSIAEKNLRGSTCILVFRFRVYVFKGNVCLNHILHTVAFLKWIKIHIRVIVARYSGQMFAYSYIQYLWLVQCFSDSFAI